MIEWIQSNWQAVTQIAAYVIAIAAVIAKVTPCETTQKWIYRILHLADLVGMNTEPTKLKED